jgi:hypothetical protein
MAPSAPSDMLMPMLVQRQHGQAVDQALTPMRGARVNHHAPDISCVELVQFNEQHGAVGTCKGCVHRARRVAHGGTLRIIAGMVMKAAGEH